MEVYVTKKTDTNDYLKNTKVNALVHLNRLMNASDVSKAPLTVKVEELTTINGFFVQQKVASDGQIIEDPPVITFLGNSLTITSFNDGDEFTFYVFGT